MATLRELNATFMKIADDHHLVEHPTLEGADYIMFVCPCGKHSECIPFPHVPKSQYSQARWQPSGTGIDDLTFIPYTDSDGKQHTQTSILHPEGCKQHYHVRNGRIEPC
jgi:hypothetical protein